jgi:hypothetical protein
MRAELAFLQEKGSQTSREILRLPLRFAQGKAQDDKTVESYV